MNEQDPCLSPDQDTRAAALYHARSVLERRGGIGNIVTPPSTMDLLDVARWIVDGDLPAPFTGAVEWEKSS